MDASNVEISAQLSNANQTLNQIEQNTKAQGDSKVEGLSKKDDGFEELKDLTSTEQDYIAQIASGFELLTDNQKQDSLDSEKFYSNFGDYIEAMLENDKAEKASLGGQAKKKNTPTSGVSITDLKSLDADSGLGFAVLSTQLADIQSELKGQGSTMSGKGLSGFFKGLLEGAAGIGIIAASLLIFAGALVVFSLVSWLPALAGLAAFSLFTVGMVIIAKKVGKETGALIEFAAASLLMSGALLVFSVALAISANVFEGKDFTDGHSTFKGFKLLSAVAALALFGAFELGIVGLSKLLGNSTGDLLKFAESSIIMAGALAAFSIALVIASNVFAGMATDIIGGNKHYILPQVNLGGAIAGLASFALFELGIVGLAKLLGQSNGDLTKFAMSSIIMSGALVTFSLGLAIASNVFAGIPTDAEDGSGKKTHIPLVNILGAIAAVASFALFEFGIAALAKFLNGSQSDLTKFALTSMLMSGALVVFSLALAIAGGVFTTGISVDIGDKHYGLKPVNPVAAIGTLALFMGFLVGMAVLANFAGGLIGQIALFSAVALLMSGALIVFSFALMTAGIASFGGEADIGPLGHFKVPTAVGAKALLAIPLMAAFIAAFAGLVALFLVPVAGQAMLAGIAMASSILLAIGAATIIMAKAIALASLISTPGAEMEWEGKKFTMPASAANISAEAFKPFTNVMSALMSLADGLSWVTAIFLPLKMPAIKSVADVTVTIAEGVLKVSEMSKTMTEEEIKTAGASFEYVFQPFVNIMDALVAVANNLGFFAGGKLKTVTESMKPVADTIDKMLDVVDKAANMNNSKSKIDEAIKAVTYLMIGDKSDTVKKKKGGLGGFLKAVFTGSNEEEEIQGGLVGMMNAISNGMRGMSSKQTETINNMKPVVEVIQSLVDLVDGDAMKRMIATDLSVPIQKMKSLVNFLIYDVMEQFGIIAAFFGKKTDAINSLMECFKSDGGIPNLLDSLQKASEVEINGQAMTKTKNGIKSITDAIWYVDKWLTNDSFKKVDKMCDAVGDIRKTVDKFDDDKALKVANGLKLIGESLKEYASISPFDVMNDALNQSIKYLDKLNDRLEETYKKLKDVSKQASKSFSNNLFGSIAEGASNLIKKASSSGDPAADILEILNRWDGKTGVKVIGREPGKAPTKEEAIPVAIFSI